MNKREGMTRRENVGSSERHYISTFTIVGRGLIGTFGL
jgi:hypothetical protein